MECWLMEVGRVFTYGIMMGSKGAPLLDATESA